MKTIEEMLIELPHLNSKKEVIEHDVLNYNVFKHFYSKNC